MFDNVDLNKPLRMICEGHTRSRWSILASADLNVDWDTVDDLEDSLTKYVQSYNDVVNTCYKDNVAGMIQLSETSICVLRYDAIRFRIVNRHSK
jgi:hypothetical protein